MSRYVYKKDKNYYERFNNALINLATKICVKSGFINIKIVTDWYKIVGKDLTSIIFPLFIYFPFKDEYNGTLVCGLNNPSYALRIQMQSKTIIQKINFYFGYNAIARIKCKLTSQCKENNYNINEKRNINLKIKINYKEWNSIYLSILSINDDELSYKVLKLAESIFDKKNINIDI
ncbi:DUF721 domain-containing protein [Lyticum sinuosum]|uniref:DUF721 domain-containing protein n=1 Tax=Lyticum sinuosum TaxID=1332059 RepID=A0AAE4VJ32_9RICK|nr:DUF721 domain-containing protein [Lyticum sinuosum]MDZ5760945.1 DUF721 domain-containing protein [Lyticum sinuosum]